MQSWQPRRGSLEVLTLVEGFEVWPGFAMLSWLNALACQQSARSLRLLGLGVGQGGVGKGKDGTIRSHVGIVEHDKAGQARGLQG